MPTSGMPPAVAVAKVPRGKGPRTRAEAHKRRQRRSVDLELDTRHQADTARETDTARPLRRR